MVSHFEINIYLWFHTLLYHTELYQKWLTDWRGGSGRVFRAELDVYFSQLLHVVCLYCFQIFRLRSETRQIRVEVSDDHLLHALFNARLIWTETKYNHSCHNIVIALKLRSCKAKDKVKGDRGRILVHSKVANFATPMLGDRRTYDWFAKIVSPPIS